VKSYVEAEPEDAAEKQLRLLMERRSSHGGGDTKSIEASWKLSDQRRAQLEHEQNRVLWAQHHAKMAEQFAMLSAEHARRARALEEGVA
jgi:hypothetical protein